MERETREKGGNEEGGWERAYASGTGGVEGFAPSSHPVVANVV